MVIGPVGCDVEKMVEEHEQAKSPWVDSDLVGAVSAEKTYRPQDDFAAYANQAWKVKTGDTVRETFQDITDATLERKKQAVTDPSVKGRLARELREYYELASSWKERNADGIAPLRKYTEDIASIQDKQGLIAFLSDAERNPLYLAFAQILVSPKASNGKEYDRYEATISTPSLCLETEELERSGYEDITGGRALEKYEQTGRILDYILKKLGYSRREAAAKYRHCLAIEKKMIAQESLLAKPAECSREELVTMAGDYPMEAVLTMQGFTDNKTFSCDKGYVKKLSALINSNPEQLKDYLIVTYALKFAKLLDRETYDTVVRLSKSRPDDTDELKLPADVRENQLMFDEYIGGSGMMAVMDRVYVENYFDDAVMGELHSMTKDVIAGLREIFAGEEWLSEEGKKKAQSKLDAVSIHIAYPDYKEDTFAALRIVSREEGGTFPEAYFAGEKLAKLHDAWISTTSYDTGYWDPFIREISTTQTNAFYNPQTNGIYIMAGVCESPAYTPDMSYEEKLGGLFTVVGHELTHGFDKDGSQYDKYGKHKAWLPMADQMEFNDRSDRVGAYYSLLHPFPGSGLYEGGKVAGEATADMGGLRATLAIASQKPDFNYKKYFKAYARMWRTNVTRETERYYISGDEHPLAFYRINVGLQQFDEFNECFGVKPGDGMYLAPKERIAVW